MEKTAQKRSLLNKLREMTNVSGIAAEKFFNPEFKKVMESLREKDDQIRSLVAGESIGSGDPGSDPSSLKDLIKSAKSNLNRREYMSAIADLGRFHKKVFDVVQLIGSLNADVDAVHHEFLFKDLSDESKGHLQDLKSRFAAAQKDALIKEASIMDFFHNIATKRGRALALWEKRYPKQVGKLKADTNKLLEKSESLLNTVLSSLKQMASARSVRNVDEYIKSANKITAGYGAYDKGFRTYYTDNVKGFLEKVDLISPTKPTTDSKELGKKDVPVEEKETHKIKTDFGPDIETGVSVAPKVPSLPPSPTVKMTGVPPTVDEVSQIKPKTIMQAPVPSAFEQHDTDVAPAPSHMSVLSPTMLSPSGDMGGYPAIPKAPPVPTGLTPISTGPTTEPTPAPSFPPEEFKSEQIAKEHGWAHANFVETLESLGNEHPAILARFISKYANNIKPTNPETAIKLLNVVKRIRG